MTMASNAANERRQQPLPPPPKEVNARKYAESRAAEIDSLHSVISNRLDNDFRSRRNKRRRTTSFVTKHHRHKNKLISSINGVEEREKGDGSPKKVPRRVRRRVELKKNVELGFSVSGDGTKRLRTHVWHAKRFTMKKFWGFYLPFGLHGSGRGSRALLKWYKQGAVVHDASYYNVVQLEGSQDALLSVMSTFLVPFPVDYSDDSFQRILSGESYGNAMLHHDRQNGSKAICPVTYVWRPFHQQGSGVRTQAEGSNENVETESSTNLRRIWIWVHPSAFAEGLDCIRLLCQKQMNETGDLLDCVSLDGKLGRIEVLGEEALQLLRKILHPVTFNCENSWGLKSCSAARTTSEFRQKSIFEKQESSPPHSTVSLKVTDPRLISDKRAAAVPDACLASNLTSLTGVSIKGDNQHNEEEVHLASLSTCKDLWHADLGVQLPMEEHLLCQERHQKSLDFFCLKDTSSVNFAPTEDNFSTVCPILVMRHSFQAGLVTGLSIILPVSWIKAFWIPLVSHGAHAIGLREKHWISCDVGLPSFPSDFPDCNAYSCLMASKAAAVDQTMQLRPPAIRPFKVPMLLPWNSRRFASDEGFGNSTGNGSSIGMTNDHLPNKVGKICDLPVIVARTCVVLSSILKEISGDHLLLFPKDVNRKSFSRLIKDETKISLASDLTALTSRGTRLCYLRVLLHAFKEGVFEEGAVICAPQFSDILLWTSGSDSGESLCVPDAFVASYFKEQSSGKWEFQLPEDPTAREAYRRPVGFVTTGFVRGSKRPSAVGLCEAVQLARLRHEQWSRTLLKKRRKEIFVLVRNLRSTAYRLALATIVLEGQEDDLEYL